MTRLSRSFRGLFSPFKPPASEQSKQHAPPKRALVRPWVLLDTACAHGEVSLLLINIGEEPAYDVKVVFNGELIGMDRNHPVSDIRLFRGLPLLRPRQEISVFYHATRLLYASDAPVIFTAKVAYRDVHGKEYVEEFMHDLEIYRDFPSVERD